MSAQCTSCTGDQVTLIKADGYHYRGKPGDRGKIQKKLFSLYHCNICGVNFEITGKWEDE
jgi:hypothetical protein